MAEVRIAGVEKVLFNLNAEIEKLEKVTIAGLLKAGLLVQRDAQKMVPVELGNLRASAYTRKAQDDPRAVEIGFEATYALFVHENVDAKLRGVPRPSGLGKYWGPSGEPQFLMKALQSNKRKILDILESEAKK